MSYSTQFGREKRFKTDVNHCIAKEIVNSQYGVFALEDLSWIREKTRLKRHGGKRSRNKTANLALGPSSSLSSL